VLCIIPVFRSLLSSEFARVQVRARLMAVPLLAMSGHFGTALCLVESGFKIVTAVIVVPKFQSLSPSKRSIIQTRKSIHRETLTWPAGHRSHPAYAVRSLSRVVFKDRWCGLPNVKSSLMAHGRVSLRSGHESKGKRPLNTCLKTRRAFSPLAHT
jgi:hypothetical protein